MLRSRDCPVCQSPPGPGLFVKDGFRHVRCPDCGLIYVSLILREDILAQYWREEITWMSVLRSEPQLQMDALKFTYGLELCQARLSGRKLLDVGAGTGDFATLAREAGWEATALELNLESGEKMRQAGIQVIVKPLELNDLPSRSFDLISLWEVLEHLAEPKAVLTEIGRLLKPEGLALILVPNAASLVTRILHEKSNTFGGHSHLNHFSPSSLRLLMERSGFRLEEMETVLTELGTINNHLDFQDPYLGEAPGFFPGLDPETIHRHLWGSRLLALARATREE
jgi:SAM-dependent methyltransferase